MLKTFLWSTYFNKRERIILFLLLLIGLILRIITAYFIPLWHDELAAFFIIRDNKFLNVFLQKNFWDTCHPPFFFISNYIIANITSDQFLLRIPALIYSSLFLYLIPIIGKKIYKSDKLFPIILLSVFAISQSQISINIVFKNYPQASLFSLISMILFFEVLKIEDNSKKYLILSIIFPLTNFLLISTLYGGIYLIAAELLFLIWLIFKNFKNFFYKKTLFLAIQVLLNIALINLILILYTVPGFNNCINILKSEEQMTFNQFIYFFNFFTSTTIYDFSTSFLKIPSYFKSIIIIIISIFGLISLNKKNKTAVLFFIFSYLITLFIFFVLTIKTDFTKISRDRTLYYLSYIILICLAYFLSNLLNNKNYITKTLSIIILMIYIIDFFGRFPYLHYVFPPYDFKKLHEILVKELNTSKKIIYTHIPEWLFLHLRYYSLQQPIKNLQIVNLKENSYVISLKNLKKPFFYLDLLFEKEYGNKYLPYFDFIEKNFNCREIIRYQINYIYLIKCF